MQNRCPMSTISPWSSTAMTRRGVAMTCRIRTDRACAKMWVVSKEIILRWVRVFLKKYFEVGCVLEAPQIDS